MLDSYQLVSGISIPILENTQCNVQYVNSVCTSTLIQELQQYNVQIKYVNPLQIEPQRINDSNLIKNKITSKIKRPLTTKQFNACRLSARVTYLSEICDINENE